MKSHITRWREIHEYRNSLDNHLQQTTRRFEGRRRARSSCVRGLLADKDNYTLSQWNRMEKNHPIFVWVSFDTLRNVVSRFISHWMILSKIRNMTRTNAHTHHVNHEINQRHYHKYEHTNFRSITWTKTPVHLKNVTQKNAQSIYRVSKRPNNQSTLFLSSVLDWTFLFQRTNFSSLMTFFPRRLLPSRAHLSLRLTSQCF